MHKKSFSTKNVCKWRGLLPCYVLQSLFAAQAKTSESPFYLGIKHKCDADSIIWYINYHSTFMSTTSKAIGITDKKVTNHSICKKG